VRQNRLAGREDLLDQGARRGAGRHHGLDGLADQVRRGPHAQRGEGGVGVDDVLAAVEEGEADGCAGEDGFESSDGGGGPLGALVGVAACAKLCADEEARERPGGQEEDEGDCVGGG
jgi:hypothetical protein